MKRSIKAIAACLSAVMIAPTFAACSGGHGGRTEIEFWYAAGATDSKIIKSMVRAYNEGQGVEDGVYVSADNRQKVDKSSLMIDAPSVVMIKDENFKAWAVEGLYHDMTAYYDTDAGSYSESDIPESLTNRFRIDNNKKDGKINAGKGAALQGVPFGSVSMVYYYSKGALADQKVNVISATEEELAAKAEYANVVAHGYAEYKEKPFVGAEQSTNLAGESVYKVFNNRIAMNWDEYRYFSKMFTRAYNETSPTTYGITQHWWFSYGWSVGGDCIGYNTSTGKYEFTVADTKPNYLVTAADGVTLAGSKYATGEIVRYEDKSKITDKGAFAELPSQYDALTEFVRTTVPVDKVVDTIENNEKVYGYGISTATDDHSAATLIDGTAAMIASDQSAVTSLSVTYQDKYDIAPALQYKRYEDGSVYYDGDKTFDNQYLKVIGEKYDGDVKSASGKVFTGAPEKVSGAEIKGYEATFSKADALVIPERSDPAAYEAAWKFIRWAASAEGQKLYMKTGNAPNQTALAFGADYVNGVEGKNYWAFANGAKTGSIGDWSYFVNGKWVNDWEGIFNNQLRGGYYTIQQFLNEKAAAANSAIGKVDIFLNGRK